VNPPKNFTFPDIAPNGILTILKPEQMQMVRINIPALLFRSSAENGFKIMITFTIVSPMGKIYNVSYKIQPEMGGMDIENQLGCPLN